MLRKLLLLPLIFTALSAYSVIYCPATVYCIDADPGDCAVPAPFKPEQWQDPAFHGRGNYFFASVKMYQNNGGATFEQCTYYDVETGDSRLLVSLPSTYVPDPAAMPNNWNQGATECRSLKAPELCPWKLK